MTVPVSKTETMQFRVLTWPYSFILSITCQPGVRQWWWLHSKLGHGRLFWLWVLFLTCQTREGSDDQIVLTWGTKLIWVLPIAQRRFPL